MHEETRFQMVNWIYQLIKIAWNDCHVGRTCNPAFRDRCYDLLGLSVAEASDGFFAGVHSGKFAVEYRSAEDRAPLPMLPSGLLSLFAGIDRIEVMETGHVLDRHAIHEVEALPGFTVLGYTGDMEVILCNHSGEGIYLLDEGDLVEDLDAPAYPSIFHYLLCQALPYR